MKINRFLISILVFFTATSLMGAGTQVLYSPKIKFTDLNGNPLSGGKLYSYSAGTTTPLATYTDNTGVTPNANPVILDSRGEADVWIGSSSYKFVLKNSADVTQWTVDNYSSMADGVISSTKLADLSVTTAKLADSAVTSAKLAADVRPTTSPSNTENLGLSATVSGGALTISLKQADGSSNPASGAGAVKIGFRSSSITSGAFNVRSATSATSLTISSGSTVGHTSAVSWQIYVYALDNSGTIELAASSSYYSDHLLFTSTAEGGAGAADSYTSLYSTSARASVPGRLIGRITITEATAGTWASNPTRVELVPIRLGCTPAPGGIGCISTLSANINCDASSAVTSQIDPNYSWVSSVSNISAGQCTITLAGNAFSAAPYCTNVRNGQNLTSIEDVQLVVSSSTSLTASCALISSGSSTISADTACDAFIQCSGLK